MLNRQSNLEALEMYFEKNSVSSRSNFTDATALRSNLKASYQNMSISVKTTLLFCYRFIFSLG